MFREYSIVWMWERSLVERLRRDGVEAKYLPFAVDPELFRPQSQLNDEGLHCDVCKVTHDVAFVATYSSLALRRGCRNSQTQGRDLGQQLAAQVEHDSRDSIAFIRQFGEALLATSWRRLQCRSTC